MLERLLTRISREGPLTIAAFMEAALYDPKEGYYTTQTPVGQDFITAPEISQMFGEILGIWLLQHWQAMGSPSAVNVVELGPGRGTLMKDVLRTWKAIAGDQVALTAYLIEISPHLQMVQKRTLQASLYPVSWLNSLAHVPNLPTFLIANEFFDALPLHQYEKVNGVWLERVVTAYEGRLHFSHTTPLFPCPQEHEEQQSFYEYCPLSRHYMEDIAKHIALNGGAGLLIDYGYTCSKHQDTLQAVKRNAYYPVLEKPGTADITAHVDFRALTKVVEDLALSNLSVIGPVHQGVFLQQNGINYRAQSLARHANKSHQEEIFKALERLTSPTEMGALFYVLGLKS